MRTYGATLFKKNGFLMVEVLGIDAAGASVVIGYVIRDPDGNESDLVQSYGDALAQFERITDDNEPPSGYAM